MSDYLPKFTPGQGVGFTADGDVVGGRLVEVTGDRTVAHATAGAAVAGVASRDTKDGDRLTVFGAAVHRVVAASAVSAGESVAAAAGGKAAAAGEEDVVIGLALTSAAKADDVFEVLV